MTTTYDPKTCATAAELRARGFKIPDNIPDAAWIREGAWTLIGSPEVSMEGTLLTCKLGSLVFLEPFRWVRVEVKEDVK